MKFVKPNEVVEVAYKAHDSSDNEQPLLQIINHDGTELYRMYMEHTPSANTARGLYTASFRTPSEPTYLACLVGGVGEGMIVVGEPDHSKIFYYDEDASSMYYKFVSSDTRRILQQGEMEPIGHNLYVISTSLDGEVILIAGGRAASSVFLPFKPNGAPVRTVNIQASYGQPSAWEMD